MTNKEALEIVTSYIPKDEPMNARDRKAFAMAIKALEQKPKTVKGEWISEIVDAEDWKGTKIRCYQPTSCSVCHKPCAIEYPFCPRCGAKMEADNG